MEMRVEVGDLRVNKVKATEAEAGCGAKKWRGEAIKTGPLRFS